MTEIEDTKSILKSILVELRGIKDQIAQQDGEYAARRRHPPNPKAVSLAADQSTDNGFEETSIAPSRPPTFSMDLRSGPVLQEALRRYRSDAVPSWSTLYGTNLAREETSLDPKSIARDSEWTSIIGNCWKIPNDNRVSFCFLAPASDPKTLVQIRNFLFHFHKSDTQTLSRGENFNVWDWFDTGISAYWFPGKTTSSMPQVPSILSEKQASFLNSRSDNRPVISHLIAPWRRIINVQGLTTLENCESSMATTLTDSDLCPFLITNSDESIFQRPIDGMIEQAIHCHLRCLRVSNSYHDELKTKNCVLFHVTFYEILQRSSAIKVAELWPCGDLHTDGQKFSKAFCQIREAALTVIAVPSSEMPGLKARSIFWTMICLRPTQFPHLYYSEQGDETARNRTNEMIDDMSDIVNQGLLTIVSRWEDIARYFDELLTEKRDLLRPDYHDSLLTDNDQFSRSKTYFWAIEFLKEAGKSVSDNIQQIQCFLKILESNPPTSRRAELEFKQRLKRHGITLQKLESLRTRFKLKKEEAMALRDGLFSASTVMDSRASYQLGQNIKLLTFISIFFSPLSFCASIWSINNDLFSLTSFAIVTPLIALSTYLTAFNLDTIASTSERLRALSLQHKTHDKHTFNQNSDKFEGPSWLWKILYLFPGQLVRGTWRFIGGLMPHRRGKQKTSEEAAFQISFGDLRDIHVKVDVKVEETSSA